MTRLLILVEGQTEDRFVSEVLREHVLAHEVFVASRILVTKFPASGRRPKGGVTSWGQIRRDLVQLLGDSNAAGITTLLDYYGLPRDVPGMSSRPDAPPIIRVRHVEDAIAAELGDRRLHPYLMLHEFEAMLFTDPWQVGTSIR